MPTITSIPLVVPTNVLLNVGTGLVSGGVLSINVNNTKFDISAGSGYVVDTFSDVENPQGVKISWGNIVGITALNMSTEIITRIGVDKVGAIRQFTADQSSSPEIIRDYIMLGSLIHTNHVSISSTSNSSIGGVAIGNPLMVADLATTIGPIVRDGCIYSAASNNMKLRLSSGHLFAFGISHKTTPKNPSIRNITENSPVTFNYLWRNGAGEITISPGNSDINVARFDDGTGGVGQPNGTVNNNSWQIQRIYLTPTVGTFIHYGQVKYSNEDAAVLGIITENTDILPELLGASFRCWLLVKGNCTDLSDTSRAKFITASKFGDIIFHN